MDFVFSMSSWSSYISADCFFAFVICYFFQSSLNYYIKLIGSFAELKDPILKST